MLRLRIILLIATWGLALVICAIGGPSEPVSAVPANDNFANAITLTPTVTTPEIAVADTTGATMEALESTPCGVGTRTVWYNWTSPANTGTVTFTTYGSNYNTSLAVYTGNTLGTLTSVPGACNDNFEGFQSVASFAFSASTTYRIQVGDAGNVGGSLVLNMGTAGVFIVNTNADGIVSNGLLSLHEAIAFGGAVFTPPCGKAEAGLIFNCNGAGFGAPDLIQFSPTVFPQQAPNQILLNGALPIMTGADFVDGAGAGVLVRPVSAGSIDCFTLVLGSNVIRRISVSHCSRGIYIDGSTSAPNNKVGPGNVISDSQFGIEITGAQAVSNQVVGNTIRNNGFGVRLSGAANQNQITGNLIGTDGTADLGNSFGVEIRDSASSNTVGGTSVAARNVISGNDIAAVGIFGTASQNKVQGNYIGTNAAGTVAIPNFDGVVIDDSANNNTIGGTAAGAGNLLSGHTSGRGVLLTGSSTVNRIEGNLIGTNAAGTAAIPNFNGVYADGSASSNMVGGESASQRNVISGNNFTGVYLGATGTGAARYHGPSSVPIPPNTNPVTSNFFVPESARVLDVNVTINISHPDTSPLWFALSGPNGQQTTLFEFGPGGANFTNTTFDDEAASSITTASPPYTGSFRPEGIPLSIFNNISSRGLWTLILTNSGTDPGTILSWSVTLTTTGNDIKGNYIGTNLAGNGAIGNSTGVALVLGSYNTVGGTIPGQGNVISGNTGSAGVQINGSNNLVAGNLIGLNAAGNTTLGNEDSGVSIQSSQNIVRSNVISGNVSGVALEAGQENKFESNLIGTRPDGVSPAGNVDGIRISGGSNNQISPGPGTANTIAFNSGSGVAVSGGTGNGVLFNSIHSNGGLGIDLNDDGITTNDLDDPDSGPNGRQNFPVLTSASTAGSVTTVNGTFNSLPSGNFIVHFYHVASCDPGGHGEGAVFISDHSVPTNAGGDATFSFGLFNVPAGRFVTAIAFDFSFVNFNSSEFSNCVASVDDVDDDNDGYTDVAEAGTPLCGNGLDDDTDGTQDDGCPAAPGQVGAFSEAQFKTGTGALDPCGLDGWPSNVHDAGGSANKLDIFDITSFLGPVRRLDKNPGQTGFNSRWDLTPGKGGLGTFLNIQDITTLLSGPSGNPPMFGNVRAFDKTCPFPP